MAGFAWFHARGWVSLGMLAEALEGKRAAMHAWSFMDIESGYFARGREHGSAQDGDWDLLRTP